MDFKLSAGDICLIPTDQLEGGAYANHFTPGKVIIAYADGSYLVRLTETGAYLVAEKGVARGKNTLGDSLAKLVPSETRVVFFGNGKFALPTLRMLVNKGFNVVGVVTMEDKPTGRGGEIRKSTIKQYAEELGLKIFQPTDLHSRRFQLRIAALKADIGVIAEYSILPYELFSLPTHGTINLHSSLLPMYRGASTIATSIMNGDSVTGVTTFVLDKGVDTGGIIANLATEIPTDATAEEMMHHLAEIGAELVYESIALRIFTGKAVPQDVLACEFLPESYAPKLHRKDCRVRWTQSAKAVHDFIRALSPVPCAWTSVKFLGKDRPLNLKIYSASLTGIQRGGHVAGELFWQGKRLYVACSDELLSLELVQLPNKRRMSALDLRNGHRGALKGFCSLIEE